MPRTDFVWPFDRSRYSYTSFLNGEIDAIEASAKIDDATMQRLMSDVHTGMARDNLFPAGICIVQS